MVSRTKISALIIVLIATVAGTAWWFLGHGQGSGPAVQKPSPPAIAAQPASTVAAAEPSPGPKPLPPQQAEEVAATIRMYLAHAPLRTPEVADPDSKANKQILQTMVLKALAQSARPSPSAPAKH
jgi:hypothetical protein